MDAFKFFSITVRGGGTNAISTQVAQWLNTFHEVVDHQVIPTNTYEVLVVVKAKGREEPDVGVQFHKRP